MDTKLTATRTTTMPVDVARAMADAAQVITNVPHIFLPTVRVTRRHKMFLRRCPSCRHVGIVNFDGNENAAFRCITALSWECGFCRQITEAIERNRNDGGTAVDVEALPVNDGKFDDLFQFAFVVDPITEGREAAEHVLRAARPRTELIEAV